jgi:hypothetical protein
LGFSQGSGGDAQTNQMSANLAQAGDCPVDPQTVPSDPEADSSRFVFRDKKTRTVHDASDSGLYRTEGYPLLLLASEPDCELSNILDASHLSLLF